LKACYFLTGVIVGALIVVASTWTLLVSSAKKAAVSAADAAIVDAYVQNVYAKEAAHRVSWIGVDRQGGSVAPRAEKAAIEAQSSARNAAERFRIAASKADAVINHESDDVSRSFWALRRDSYSTMAESAEVSASGYAVVLDRSITDVAAVKKQIRLMNSAAGLHQDKANLLLMQAYDLLGERLEKL
jgi:membrane-bound lytic murein transglycosylase B